MQPRCCIKCDIYNCDPLICVSTIKRMMNVFTWHLLLSFSQIIPCIEWESVLFVRHALLAAIMSLASHFFFFFKHSAPIASCVPFRPCLTGDTCTGAFSCQKRILSSYAANNMRSCFRMIYRKWLQCNRKPQFAPNHPTVSHLNPLNWQYLLLCRAHFISYVCLCTCPSTPINLVYLSGRFALDCASLWSILY